MAVVVAVVGVVDVVVKGEGVVDVFVEGERIVVGGEGARGAVVGRGITGVDVREGITGVVVGEGVMCVIVYEGVGVLGTAKSSSVAVVGLGGIVASVSSFQTRPSSRVSSHCIRLNTRSSSSWVPSSSTKGKIGLTFPLGIGKEATFNILDLKS